MILADADQRIHICTSGSCNNNCVFCCDRDPHVKAGRRHLRLYGATDLTMDGFKTESKRPKGTSAILFTGGEPTLNPSLKLFVARSSKSGYTKIGLQTNGRLFRYAAFGRDLLDAGLNEISLSLHGSLPEIHEAHTRTPGSFDDSWKGLSNLLALKKKYPLSLTIHCTVTRMNLRDIPDFLEKILSLGGIDRVILNMLMVTGNALTSFSLLKVSYRDMAHVMDNLPTKIRDARVSVNAIPPCLFPGQKGFRGISEQPLRVKDGLTRGLERSSRKIKHAACRACPQSAHCEGIDAYYAATEGWGEFPFFRKEAHRG